MRTLSIITAFVSFSALSSVANAGLNLANGIMMNGVQFSNGTSIDVNLNSMQVLEVVLPSLRVASVHLPHRNSVQESGQGNDRS